jgi:hypothetical protein
MKVEERNTAPFDKIMAECHVLMWTSGIGKHPSPALVARGGGGPVNPALKQEDSGKASYCRCWLSGGVHARHRGSIVVILGQRVDRSTLSVAHKVQPLILIVRRRLLPPWSLASGEIALYSLCLHKVLVQPSCFWCLHGCPSTDTLCCRCSAPSGHVPHSVVVDYV